MILEAAILPHVFPFSTLYQSAQKRRSSHVEKKQTVGFISVEAYIKLRKEFAYCVSFIQVVFCTQISALQPELKCVGFLLFVEGSSL
jgi:hypothetical protein